ncbi:branched-chain amino acid ABC transporter [Aliidongia dinghuensis]|uniref:Branched-chain amino acid ABC transporter n=1 Tax=Aliidongia dinghuensis TaxID=1867774 RepID=A0A8J2YTB0_9PROT|nr:branched-chain amino acid ABC transporter ATP-binding protein/permease [Aliidongia dinghuensis]GGF18705.1 branched-chain amino acid ABC transporter [Aliidongia dinghuensis]
MTTRSILVPLLLIAAAASVIWPLVQPMNGYLLNLFMQAATYAMAVLGLTVVLGYAGQISIAQAAFFGLGAYGVAIGTTMLHLPFMLALLLGVAVAAVFGAILGASTLKLGGHYLAMVTISFQQILTLVLTNWIGLTNGPDGIRNIPRPALFGISWQDSDRYLALCLVVLYAVGTFVWWLKGTKLGLGMQAVRDNELAAEVVGVDTYRVKVTAFCLSALLGGLGGGLFAGGFGYISPDQFSFGESVVFLTMVLLGGADAAVGSAVGTALLILLPEWLRFLRGAYLAVYGLAVILIMVFMPTGLWGVLSRLFGPPKRRDHGVVEALSLGDPDGEDGDLLLEIKGLAKHFGGLKALDGVDIAVERGKVHALIGPNGSGKTTMLNVLSGIYRPTRGEVRVDGVKVSGLPPHEIAAAGVGRTFQNIRLFHSLTVFENVVIGAQRPRNPAAATPDQARRRALAALEFVGMAGRADIKVASLPYGHQRLVEIARALAGNPTLLLLDEPAAGLNLTEKQELVGLLKRLAHHGLTLFLIDHDMNLVEQMADRITVLNFGKRIAEGTPAEVLRHPDVIAAYLGEVPDHAAA